MDTMLLATKVRVPPPPHDAVPRTRLLDALEHAIPRYRLMLLSAPAGYGKTTLLAQWARTSGHPTAWLSLGAEDNDLERFLRVLLVAWQQIQPRVRESPLGLLLGGLSPDTATVLAAFINVANVVPAHLVFILDDYQLIDDPAIHHALTWLLDRLPPTLHICLACRADPPLPLARYRARHQVLELRTAALQFGPDETADFLERRMGLALTHTAAAAVHTGTEGWITGVQLVGLALRQFPAGEQIAVSGTQRFIADYLSEEVVARLPEAHRHFLLQTSILEQLCGSLCDAVTEGRDGQTTLERLERGNLFLVPLDDSRAWYRYHALFADFLRAELQHRLPDHVTDLHRRAARWFLAQDLPDQAFRHAVAGDDVTLVTQLVERYVYAKLLGGEFRVVQSWIDALPAAWTAAYPALGLARARVLAATGAVEACLSCVDAIEQQLMPAEGQQAREQLAKVTAVRCFIACMQNDLERAEVLADRALRELPPDDLGFRPGIYGVLGDSYRQHGRWEDARAAYLRVLDFTAAPAVRVRSVHFYGALADLALRQGQLHDAAAYWRRALVAMDEPLLWGRVPLPLMGWVGVRLAEVLYEWNDLPQAREHLAHGLERAELGGDVRALVAGYLLAGRLALTGGDIAAAAAYLERVRPLAEQAPFADCVSGYEAFQLRLWLVQDRRRAAVGRADELLRGAALIGRVEGERAQLAAMHALIVAGDVPALEQAQALLRPLFRDVDAAGRAGLQIEALALQALAHWRRGDTAAP